MTLAERGYALQTWGYTEQESDFLVLAALGSGYFQRRQYNSIHKSGSQAGRLIEKLVQRKHASILSSDRRYIVHLNNAAMYRRLGDNSSRNRRTHQLPAIKERLMGLDFILGEGGMPLLTGEDKREYLREHGVPESDMPQISHKEETKYFPDRVILTVDPDGLVSFAFIDEGGDSEKNFNAFLQKYTPVFRVMERFRVVYVCTSGEMERVRRNLFESFVMSIRPGDYPAETRDLLEWFKLRRAAEIAGHSFSLTVDQMRQLRHWQTRFCAEEYDALYREYRKEGAQVLPGAKNAAFEVCVLSHDYSNLLPWGSTQTSSTNLRRLAPPCANPHQSDSKGSYDLHDGSSDG